MSTITPKGFRLHLGIFGRRNVGKSSLLNALTRQTSSIVSDIAGTTTDPVEKTMELLPLGPVLFIDTAGLDDSGELGTLRIQKTRQVFDRTEIGLLVIDRSRDEGPIWSHYEEQIVQELTSRNVPVLIVLNKKTAPEPEPELRSHLDAYKLPWVCTELSDPQHPFGLAALKEALVRIMPADYLSPPAIVADLIPPGEFALLVVPIDKEAPKGRLILPQVQTIRDLLDEDRGCLVIKETRLAETLTRIRPALVVTDSQAFHDVARIVPESIPLTSFSILFARQKGDLKIMAEGARAIGRLRSDSHVLIAEACTHHPISEDIGTEKIPRWLRNKIGSELSIDHVQGHDFPASTEELASWDLVIHCGACMWNRREVLARIARCHESSVPITNYGLAIAYLNGILDRALQPFN